MSEVAMFTDREKELGCLVAQGKTGPEIAEAMDISEHTVRKYIHRMGRLIPGSGPPMRRIALHFNDPEGEGAEVGG